MKCWIKIWFSIFLFTCQLIKIRSHNLLLFSYENISSFDALSQIYSPHTTYEKIFLILSYLSLGIFHDGFGTLKILLLNITLYYYWILNWGAIIVHCTGSIYIVTVKYFQDTITSYDNFVPPHFYSIERFLYLIVRH